MRFRYNCCYGLKIVFSTWFYVGRWERVEPLGFTTVGCRGPTEYERPRYTAAQESLPHLQNCKPYPTFYSMLSHVHYPHGVTISPYLLITFLFFFFLLILCDNYNEEELLRQIKERYFLRKKKDNDVVTPFFVLLQGIVCKNQMHNISHNNCNTFITRIFTT